MTHCCCVDSELGLCQFYWVSIFVCILRFQGYFHHKVSNPIYACDTIKQSFSHLTSPKSHTNKIYQQMQNRTPSPRVNTMIIMIKFNANCKSIQTIKQTSYLPDLASSVSDWATPRVCQRRCLSGETPNAMFDQKSLYKVCACKRDASWVSCQMFMIRAFSHRTFNI